MPCILWRRRTMATPPERREEWWEIVGVRSIRSSRRFAQAHKTNWRCRIARPCRIARRTTWRTRSPWWSEVICGARRRRIAATAASPVPLLSDRCRLDVHERQVALSPGPPSERTVRRRVVRAGIIAAVVVVRCRHAAP